MQDVALIIPPSGFLLDERVFPSLGILKIAAVLEQYHYRPTVLDLSGIKNYEDHLCSQLESETYDAIGITATTPQMPAVMRLLDVCQEQTAAKIILGGPHFTLSNDRYDHTVVRGDGEKAVLDAITKVGEVFDGDDIRGHYFLSNEDFDRLPPPARHLIDLDSYHYEIDGERATSIVSQLGCPFPCGFCGGRNTNSLRRIRTRSVASVLDEIWNIYTDYGYRGFMFYDDELNVNRQMIPLMRELAAMQKTNGLQFKMRGFVKAELLTSEQADAMAEAGFREILCGFESGHPRILRNINKRATIDDNVRCLETARNAGLRVKALMSIGHPGESSDTVDATKRWLLDVAPDDFDCTIVTVYPGTPYHDESQASPEGFRTYTQPRTGDRLHFYDVDLTQSANYYKGIPGEYESYTFTDHLSESELVNLRDALEAEVRETLRIPAPQARHYDHSMGQS